MSRPRTLRAGQAFGTLAALLRDPWAAAQLADEDLLRVFPRGAPQHVAALLAFFPERVTLHGWEGLFKLRPLDFLALVEFARRPPVPAAIREPLSERVALHEVRDLVEQLARVPIAVVFDGRRTITELRARAKRPPRRRLRIVDYVLARPAESEPRPTRSVA
ncbi:hypothetical protein J421_4680 (plasmid) [Gemmatirosa kalamazoonensis]|uniref:Uncharacterized protein n=1 Tax=Gemmatirosa kalamazoonensis TaxID=861299 RepID=W0RRD4_9BACT|nr:hypothetical protein [Gemmatirosa kalamazoonensis]AHG92148.1 hypothetical protein J421_4613 [Gemmatirosa kalamazoonensis]AHG92215.1 hypothetical protein J421_4680 [Gemmatirosa kalamazoonensis]